MENRKNNPTTSMFPEESLEIIQRIYEDKENPYVSFIYENLTENRRPLKDMIEHGLKYIPTNFPNGGDMKLSSYFFILSELKNIDTVIKSFLLDVSVYCEGAYDYDHGFRSFNPNKVYLEKMKPLL